MRANGGLRTTPWWTRAERAASERAGAFGWVRPVHTDGAVQVIDVKTRVNPSQGF